MPSAGSSSSKRRRSTRPRRWRGAVRTSTSRTVTWRSGSWRCPPLPAADDVRLGLEQRFRTSHGRAVAALTRRFGVERLPLIENAIQDAYVRALERWPSEGTPERPEQWIVRVAYFGVIDSLRRDRRQGALDPGREPASAPPSVDEEDELRLMFLCCHPSLPRAAQIALVLNVAFGLTARQIASAFMSDERTVAQRIVRAKQRVRDEGLSFEVPAGGALGQRL